MAHCFFGQFLLQQGLVSEDELTRCALLQGRSNLLLGELAIQLGLLTIQQTAAINQRQALEDKRFGDIAVEIGLLSTDQIELLLQQQKQEHKFLGEILVAEGVISVEQLQQQLDLHRLEREATLSDFHSFISEHPLEGAIAASISLVQKLFLRSLKSQCHFGCQQEVDELEPSLNCASITLHSIPPLSVAISCSDEVLRRLSANFMGLAEADCSRDLYLDAQGEIVNILAGYMLGDCATGLQGEGLGVPVIDQPLAAAIASARSPVAIKMDSLQGEFMLLVWQRKTEI